MKKILVPTDFSASAVNAVNFAVQSAKTLPIDVTIIHVFDEADSMYTDYMGINKEYKAALKQDLRDKLDLLRLSILEAEGIAVKTKLIAGGITDAIMQEAKEEQTDLIVMGTFGANGILKKITGSKTAAVIGNSSIPVLAIPYEYEWKKPQRFLLATNHFEKEAKLLNFLFELAALYMADVKVAVYTDEQRDSAFTMVEHSHDAASFERMLKERYHESAIETTHLYGENFGETLQHHITRQQIDILVMITYQRSLISRIFHPSVTKQMSYITSVPLLVLPAGPANEHPSN